MIYDRILFHNVEEMEETDRGMRMWRLPGAVREQLNENLRMNTARFGTGIELRFRMNCDKAVIYLSAEPGEEANACFIYYGSIQGGWQYSSRIIGTEKTAITIIRPENREVLQRVSEERHLPFSPDVVRIVLPYGNICYLGHEGDIEPPLKTDLPAKTYLAYGSSITHGSLALGSPHTYVFQIGRILGCDYLNKGFAGTALAERAAAEWILGSREWDIAGFELGINMIFMDEEEFREQIRAFLSVLAKDRRPMFFTDIFGMNDSRIQGKADRFRHIVRAEYEEILGAAENTHYTDGLTLLNEPEYVSQDMVHPSLEGQWTIAERWSTVMRRSL